MTKVFKKDQTTFMRDQLGRNEKWAKRALIRIFEHQTADEQNTGSTNEYNNVGFTGADAEILTSFAKQLIYKKFLSPKQMAILYRKMPKYSRQIIELSDKTKLNSKILAYQN